jgi:succinate dehydrogenase, hydrophobic membrane anchor protein
MTRHPAQPASGAHSGTGLWLMQRASALLLAIFIPVLILRIVAFAPLDFARWQALFAPLWMRVGVLLLMTAAALHAWVGVRDIGMDYLHHTGLRLALYLAAIVTLAASVLWLAAALWQLPGSAA